MFFCAGFFHCFFIVNQTEHGCEKQCGDLNANIAGLSDHLIYDSAQKFLEKREEAELLKPGQGTKLLGYKEQGSTDQNRMVPDIYTRLYTGIFFNFTSRKWIDDHEMYNHSDITFISTSYTLGVNRSSDQQCKETLRVRLHAITLNANYTLC